MDQIDILNLRGALRLVHFIQEERSSTLCFVISKHGDITNSPPISEIFSSLHKKSDATLTQYRQYRDKENVSSDTVSVLRAARGMFENDGTAVKLEDESSKRGFVSVLLANSFQSALSEYNEVIEQVLKNGVFKYRPVATPISLPRQHSSTLNLVKSIMGDFDRMNMDISSLLHSFTALRTISKYTKLLMKEEASRNKGHRSHEDQRVVSLFCILMNLLRLKESSHIKNLIFTQLLASSDGSQVQVVINYLIIHIAEETSMIVTVEEMAKSVTNSIFASDFLQPSEKLSTLVQLVLNEFNLDAFQKAVSVDDFLKLSTAYHDKLHGLELFILEQIESCQYLSSKVKPLRNPNLSPNGIPEAVTAGLALLASNTDNTAQNAGNVQRTLSNIPAEDLKRMILSMMEDKRNEKGMKASGRKSHNIRFNEKSSSTSTHVKLGTRTKEKSTTKSRSQMMGSMSQKLKIEKAEASCLPELLPVIAEWGVALDEIHFRKKIGSGSAGTTYLARWRREEVAVKVATATPLGILSWNMEIRALQKLHHPNIIRMMGCIYTETPFAMSLILEYCNLGDLSHALSSPTPPNFFNTVVMGLSTGLEYLHSKGIIHRDVKPDNILIHGKLETCDFSVKLTDFGLSTTFEVTKHLRNLDDSVHSAYSAGSSGEEEEEEEHTAEAGTYRYMAPEVIRHESYDFKVDVYSFGVVLWQLLTREKPFHNNTQEEAAKLVALGYQRPPFPRGVPKAVMSVIDMAWEEDPDDRPNFNDLSEIIDKWNEKDALTGTERAWLDHQRGHPVYNKKKAAAQRGSDDGGRKGAVRRRSGSGFFSRGKSPGPKANRRESNLF